MLTDVGTLVSLGGDYELDLDLGDFCVDWVGTYGNSFILVCRLINQQSLSY